MTSSDPFDIPHIRVESGDYNASFSGSWYRGPHTNWIPSKAQLIADDAVDRFIMEGWRPRQPFLNHSSRITAFGSCFAQNISKYLTKRKYNILGKDLSRSAHIIRFGEGMVNTFAIRQQFEWAAGERNFDDVFWIGPNKEIASHDPAIRDETREIILSTDTFIITLGLSEIWYNKRSGEAFWRAIPMEIFDERRHGFRVSTVDENRENLSAIRRIIRSINADANIVLTLSPLPLMATFRPVSCLTANSVSKAILRVAVDEFMRQHTDDTRTFYFPSYEIVNELFADQRGEDNRHIRPDIIDFVMQNLLPLLLRSGLATRVLLLLAADTTPSLGGFFPSDTEKWPPGPMTTRLRACSRMRAAIPTTPPIPAVRPISASPFTIIANT